MRRAALLAMAVILAALLTGCAGEEADETSPVISEVGASDITTSTATIVWTTDEPATSQVEYGLTTSYGSTTTLDEDLVTSHGVILSGLTADTTYHYRVKSEDASENEAVSGDYTFTTPANESPAQPSNVSPADGASDVSLTPTLTSTAFSDPDAEDTHAASQWQVTTTSGDYSSPVFDSGTDTTNLSSISVPSGILNSTTTYYWRVRHEDNHVAWSAWSEETSFTTTTTEIVTFPDPNLEAVIREAIGKPEGPIYPSDLEGLTSLNASGRDITDLTGLEHCTSLTGLDLSWNQISDISSLSGLTGLTELHLWRNQISDVSPLSGLTSLTELDLSDNQISDVTPLQGLTNLTSLNLGVNQISDITPLVENEGLSGADTLDLRDNPLSAESLNTSIPQLEARGVEVLYSSEPQAVTFPDPNLEAVIRETIRKPEDPIYPSDLEGLTSLNASGRDIADLTGLEYCHDLAKLYLNRNQISDLTPLQSLTSLTKLWLPYNQISSITPLSSLTSLTYLNLGFNQVSDITGLSNLTALTELTLSDNQISDITSLSNLTGLTWLSMYGNQISDLTPLGNMTSLKELIARDNQISDLTPLEDLTSLTSLNLSQNQISDISPLQNLTGLTFLFLYDNAIVDASPVANLTSLTYLCLDGNQISNISPLANLANLSDLDLSDNQISDITPLVDNEGLSSGDMVDLRGNPLSTESLNILIPQLQTRGVTMLYDTP